MCVCAPSSLQDYVLIWNEVENSSVTSFIGGLQHRVCSHCSSSSADVQMPTSEPSGECKGDGKGGGKEAGKGIVASRKGVEPPPPCPLPHRIIGCAKSIYHLSSMRWSTA